METKLKDIISSLFYKYDLGRLEEQKEFLLQKCLSVMTDDLEIELDRTIGAWHFFILQVALENLGR